MTRLGRTAAGARNVLNTNEGWDFTEWRMKLKKFLYGNKYLTHECFAEKMEKRVRKILSERKVQRTDDLSGVEKAESGDQEHEKKGGGVLPLLSNVMVVEGAAEMALKGAGKLVSVRDKSLKAGAAEIGSSMLGLDGIESMENVKQILAKMQNLEEKVDAGFQRMDHKFEEVELLIKSRCGGGGPPRPRPPQSGSGGGESGIDESSGGIDIED